MIYDDPEEGLFENDYQEHYEQDTPVWVYLGHGLFAEGLANGYTTEGFVSVTLPSGYSHEIWYSQVTAKNPSGNELP